MIKLTIKLTTFMNFMKNKKTIRKTCRNIIKKLQDYWSSLKNWYIKYAISLIFDKKVYYKHFYLDEKKVYDIKWLLWLFLIVKYIIFVNLYYNFYFHWFLL